MAFPSRESDHRQGRLVGRRGRGGVEIGEVLGRERELERGAVLAQMLGLSRLRDGDQVGLAQHPDEGRLMLNSLMRTLNPKGGRSRPELG
jgi:hypothetical protein